MSILDNREKILSESEDYLPLTEDRILSRNFIKRSHSYLNTYQYGLSSKCYVEMWGPLGNTIYMGVNMNGQLINIVEVKVRKDVSDFIQMYEGMAY